MTTYWENVHSETVDGFDIVLSVTPEDDSPDWDFDSEEDRLDLIEKINNGLLIWFVAKVTASKHGVALGIDCLGGCCYESIEDFVKSGDYYDGMKAESISEANKTLLKLTS